MMATQPPDFIPDDEAPDFIPDEVATPDPQAEPAASTFLKSAGGAFVRSFNPVEIARNLKAMAELGMTFATRPYSPEASEAVDALVSAPKTMVERSMSGPEGLGETVGSLAAGAVPVGRLGAAGLRRGVPILGGANEASRAYNVKRALRAPAGTQVARDIESMAPEIDMPVVASPRKLAQRMTAARETAGAAVGTAEDALPTSNIPVSNVTSRIEPPPGQWVWRGNTLEFVPDDPALWSAYRASIRRLEEPAGGPAGSVTTQDLIRQKRSAQGVADRGRAYASERAGLGAKAAEARGSAIREELEAIPGPESAEFTKANRRFNVAATAEGPIVAEAARLSDLPIAGRGVEMLLGRAIPGSGFARQALGGLAGGAILDSTLFHTASAAVKRQVIDALKTGMPQKAADILFRASVLESQRRRSAAAELAAQGEGVTTP